MAAVALALLQLSVVPVPEVTTLVLAASVQVGAGLEVAAVFVFVLLVLPFEVALFVFVFVLVFVSADAAGVFEVPCKMLLTFLTVAASTSKEVSRLTIACICGSVRLAACARGAINAKRQKAMAAVANN